MAKHDGVKKLPPENTALGQYLRRPNESTYDARWTEIQGMLSSQYPQCCEESKKACCIGIRLRTPYHRSKDTHKENAYWAIKCFQPNWPPEGDFEPKVCPFCAKPLPKLVRKDPMPEWVCRITDGGYYCDTCGLRCSDCLCDPMTSAFEQVENTGP